jgi:mttA/Hcf106 family
MCWCSGEVMCLQFHLFGQAVKALGNTLRTFQPTIRELASVSSELRNTLEEQIGLDEIRQEFRSATLPPPQTKPVFTDMPSKFVAHFAREFLVLMILFLVSNVPFICDHHKHHNLTS